MIILYATFAFSLNGIMTILGDRDKIKESHRFNLYWIDGYME